MTPDLLSLIITLRNPRPISMAYDQGRALAAEFLNWVQEIDPNLSNKLHDPQRVPRPYTVSNLFDLPKPNKSMVLIPPDSKPWFRITSFSPELTRFIFDQLLPALSRKIQLGDGIFEFDHVVTDPEKHIWAGAINYNDLINHYMMGRVNSKTRHHFASPTSFHSKGNHMPYILPELALRSWMTAWNAYAPVEFPDDILDQTQGSVAISYYRLQTIPVRYGNATFIGGMGNCTFNIVNEDPYWMHLVNILSAFSFYCGTGVKTALGMGQTRRLGDSFYRGLNST
jgi:CRISPR-associated endoribonuclease Cas6